MSLIEEARSSQKYYTEISSAEKIFTQQKAAIQAIRNESGYKEIKMYWKREAEACVNRLMTTKKGELPEVQGELRAATKFLNYLDGLESAER